ncbi:MAG: peptidoglycan-binding protein [Ruminococcaceae bacterium]|nr:peptidoglycan-binding protein [Oscillospiraceae bacterium]
MTNKESEKQAIRDLQRYLRQLSYVDPRITRPPIDGVFDSATRTAVRDFQRIESLPETGVVDTALWELIFQRYEASLVREGAPVPLAAFPRLSVGYALREGDESFLVRLLQYALGELDLIYQGNDDVPQSGAYDEATAKAVREFQQRAMLPQTGEVDRATWDALATVYNREFGGYQRQ